VSDLRLLKTFSSLLKKKKKKCPRITRYKLVTTTRTTDGHLIVTRLIPWMRTGKNYVWMASLAAGKSRRQINDWLLRRTRRKRVQQFDRQLTGLGGTQASSIALRQVYVWLTKIPPGDMIMFNCESAKAEKQMKAWQKWINRHNPDLLFDVDHSTKSFYIYKPRIIE
jgi:hypothetical protein